MLFVRDTEPLKIFWQQLFFSWRFYTLSPNEYKECMEKYFATSNLLGLRQANLVVAVLVLCFSFFPIVVEKNLHKASVYFLVAAIALLFAIVSRHQHKHYKKTGKASKLLISGLTILYFINIMFFGIYIGVLDNTVGIAASFMGFLIVALFLFLTSPLFHLCLTLCAVTVFIICSVVVKIPHYWTYDIVNGLLAAVISLVFGWQINKYRISAVLSSSKLEEERNKYYKQSMIDELTQLKNRRDFMQTFQRYLTNFRSSDDWLCIAIIDIDFFKNYNDYYGHPSGDECLRSIGKALNYIKDSMNICAARIGGEEFALLWFEKDPAGVKNVVSQVFKEVRSLDIPHKKSKAAKYVTVSIGVYVMPCGVSNNTDLVYKSADTALYEAKEKGRNCAIIAGETFERYTIKPDN